MGKIKSSELVNITFKGDVSDDLCMLENKGSWGFAMVFEDMSAYVSIGSKLEMEKEIIKHDDSPLLLVVDAIMNSTDEAVESMFATACSEAEGGMVINGVHFDQDEIEEAIRQRGNVA